MDNQYEAMRKKLLSQLDEMEQWESVQMALNKTLPNDSDTTNYEAWLEGSKRFAKDNEDLLKALMK